MCSHIQILTWVSQEIKLTELSPKDPIYQIISHTLKQIPHHDEMETLQAIVIVPLEQWVYGLGYPPEMDAAYERNLEDGLWVGTIYINGFYLQRCQTLKEQKNLLVSILAHEYGHHYTMYWRYYQQITKGTSKEEASKIFREIHNNPLPEEYWELRGTQREEVLNGIDTSHRDSDFRDWIRDDAEIFAEDYVFLLCSAFVPYDQIASSGCLLPPKPALHRLLHRLPYTSLPSLENDKRVRLRPDRWVHTEQTQVLQYKIPGTKIQVDFLDLDCTGGAGATVPLDSNGSEELSLDKIYHIINGTHSITRPEHELFFYICRTNQQQIGGVLLQKNSAVLRPSSNLYQQAPSSSASGGAGESRDPG